MEPFAKTSAVRESYERLAPEYDRRWNRYVEATLGATLAALGFGGRERVLDLACGTGELGRRLLGRHPGLRVVGVDLTAGMLRRASGKIPAGAVGWAQADAGRLPLRDAAFDLAVCANSFHYFRSPDAALGEARRVLRPGGRLVLVDWCDDYLSCKACSLWLRWTDPAFHRAYSLDECRARIGRSGFEVVEHARFKIDWLWGLMRLVARRPDGGCGPIARRPGRFSRRPGPRRSGPRA